MDAREARGRLIAENCKITSRDGVWFVPSATVGGATARYAVRLGPDRPSCTCKDWELREMKCKHIFAVEFSIKRQQNPDGSVTETRTTTVTETVKRPTYKQVWP